MQRAQHSTAITNAARPSRTQHGHPQTQHAPRPGPWGVRMKKSYRRCDEKSEYKRYECSLSFVIHRSFDLVPMREFIWPAIDKRSFLGNCYKCDDYPDRIDTTLFSFFLRAKLAYYLVITKQYAHFFSISHDFLTSLRRAGFRKGWGGCGSCRGDPRPSPRGR